MKISLISIVFLLSLCSFAQVAMPSCNHPDGHCPELLSKKELKDIKKLDHKAKKVCKIPLINHLKHCK